MRILANLHIYSAKVELDTIALRIIIDTIVLSLYIMEKQAI